MAIVVGDKLPAATLLRMGEAGIEEIAIADYVAGRKVVIFGLPGAFTGTCSMAHVPSFIRTKAQFEAKGVEEIICVSVNDAFVMKAWAAETGAAEAGLSFLADANSELTKALGLAFSNPKIGFIDRSLRYALYAEDGVVKVLQVEENAGVCTVSGGEALLEAL